MKPDIYYGSVAANYDTSRSGKTKWRNENEIVKLFLTKGPVLDVPFGTGRFVPIYRVKGLTFVGIDISRDMIDLARSKFPQLASYGRIINGDLFNLPQRLLVDFQTVVCIRFLEWFPMDRALEILVKLKQSANTLIVSVNHGEEGQPDAYTYDLDKFYKILEVAGLFVVDHRVTAAAHNITSEIFKLGAT